MMKLQREEVIKYTLDLQEEELIPGALRILCFSKPIYDDLNSDELLDAIYELRHRREYRAIADYIYRRWMKIDYPHRNVQPEPIVSRPQVIVTPKKFIPRPSPLVTSVPTKPIEAEEPKDIEMGLRKELGHQLIYAKQCEVEDDLEVSDDDEENDADRTICDSDTLKDKQDEYYKAAMEDMMSMLGVSSLEELEEVSSSTENTKPLEISCIQGTSVSDDFSLDYNEDNFDDEISYNESEDGVLNTAICEEYTTESETEDQEDVSDNDELNEAIVQLDEVDSTILFKSPRSYERYVRA